MTLFRFRAALRAQPYLEVLVLAYLAAIKLMMGWLGKVELPLELPFYKGKSCQTNLANETDTSQLS